MFGIHLDDFGSFNELVLFAVRIKLSTQLSFLWKTAFISTTWTFGYLCNQSAFEDVGAQFETAKLLIHPFI